MIHLGVQAEQAEATIKVKRERMHESMMLGAKLQSELQASAAQLSGLRYEKKPSPKPKRNRHPNLQRVPSPQHSNWRFSDAVCVFQKRGGGAG